MNEKELTKMCNKSTSDCIELAKQLKEIQQRIDKAIEYINKNDLLFELLQNEKAKNELLHILRGKDNDSN